MPLDLEIIGPARDLTEDETSVNRPVTLKRLRDSHHAVAHALAHGLTPFQVSLQTGYAPSRISVLQRDPMFQELMEFYRRDAEVAAQEVEAQMLLVGKDVLQEMHERVLDDEDIPLAVLNDVFKTVMDRAGYAPVQRSINKNLNLNIGDRMDAAARKRKDAA